MQAEPERQVEDHAHHRRGDRGERARQAWPLPDRRDIGGAGEDPQEAGREGHPQGHRSAGDTAPDAAHFAIGGEEAHELGDEDERPRRGFGQGQAVDHFGGAEPAFALHRRLRHVGEHRIGAAEGDHGEFREEDTDLGQHMMRTQQKCQRGERYKPHRAPDRHRSQQPARMRQGFGCGSGKLASAQESVERRSCDDQWKGQAEGEERQEGEAGNGPVGARGECTPGHTQQRLEDDGQHRRLDAEEGGFNQGQPAEGRIENGQCQHDGRARQHEEKARGKPAPHAMQFPSGIGGELHAEVERGQIFLLAQPAAAFHDLAMHERDLAGRAAEGEAADSCPGSERIPE